jgi:hypothetical protein
LWGEIVEIAEGIAVAVVTGGHEDCWFCKEKPKDENAKTDLDEEPSSVGKLENDLKNDSSKLGNALGHRPSWMIALPNIDTTAQVVPAAHHLIPGNAALNKVTKLVDYLKAGSKIRADVGYNVNARENGIWLPGSYGINPSSVVAQKWSAYPYQNQYAIAAMKRGRAQFHDAHPTYSERVKTTLRTIADRIVVNHPEKCPGCGEKLSDKARPPYGIVGRLENVSRRHRVFLRGPVRRWPLGSGYFTSSRSALMKTSV